MKFNAFNNANTLIRPEVDSSERQVLARNGFLTKKNKVKLMMAAEEYLEFNEFKPKEHGKHSKAENFIIQTNKNRHTQSHNLSPALNPLLAPPSNSLQKA
jgi:hypothetical protein